jgi:hypothetical protein
MAVEQRVVTKVKSVRPRIQHGFCKLTAAHVSCKGKVLDASEVIGLLSLKEAEESMGFELS